jgi:hypothetical protein
MLNPTTLFNANTPADQAHTARLVAEREGWSAQQVDGLWCVATALGFPPHEHTYSTPEAAWSAFLRNRYEWSSTDAILALLARDGMEWGKVVYKPMIYSAEHLIEIDIPDQQPATIAHALRCLWLAALGVEP